MAASNPFPDVSPDGDRIALVRLIAGPAADRVLVSQPGIGTYTRRIDGQGAPALLTPTTGAAEPVGDVVVTDDGDGVLRARDPVTGQQRGPALPMGGTAQYLLPYGPTQVLAVVRRSTGDAAVQVWDLRTGVTPGPHALPAGPTIVWNVRVDPLRRSVALAVDKRAFVYDVDTGAMPFATPEQTDWVDDAAPSPDGRWLATSGADGRVLIWPRLHAVVPGQPTYRFLGHAGAVERVEWDATSRGLVSAGTFDGTVRHWALPADLHFDGHRSWVVDLDLSADGRHLVTGSPDDTAQVIAVDAPTAPPLVTLTPGAHVAAARFVPADPSSVVLLTDYGDAPELWRWTGGAPSRGVPFEPLPGRYLTSIDVSPDGRTVVGGDDLGELHLWDTGTGRLRGVPPALFTATTPDPGRIGGGVAFDPRGELIASANGREILVWRRDASGAFTPERSLPLPSVVDVVFNPSGDVIAGGTQDGHIMVWHRDGRPALDRPLSAEGSQRLGRFSVSADARRVGAGDASGLVQVWDVATGELLTSGRHHGDAVNDVVFLAPDGSRLASASDDQTVAIWDCDACRDPRAALAAAERAADAPGGEPDR
jgi:WD40 repeat protein